MPQLSADQWKRIEALYEIADVLPESERAGFIAELPDGDEVRVELERLLHASEAEHKPLFEHIVTSVAAHVAEDFDPDELRLGSQVGPYRMERILGRGGMGAVYLAVRNDGAFQQTVAIKLIRAGAGTQAIMRHFRQEREILSALQHPNIARLLDGGTLSDGTPYLVMEYIEGEPITAWSRKSGAGVGEKIHLFKQLCSGVEYAHRHLVVHRDIKPGNILVTPDGTPKLLDFGIAKLIDPSGPEMMTMTVGRMLTPQYASPEQVRGERITTASDVYSLGCVRYELLSESRPYKVGNDSATKIAEVVCDTSPDPPSAVAPTPQLKRQLNGDLDHIVMMALRKEPERRYRSAGEFADDLQRYTNGQPVRARPDTFTYRAGKFIQRYRYAVSGAALAAVLIIAAAGLAIHQGRRAERRFEDVRAIANSFLFDVDTRLDSAGPTAAHEQIVTTALRYLERLAADSASDAALQADLIAAYQRVGEIQQRSLGRMQAAERSYANAIRIAGPIRANTKLTARAKESLARSYLGLSEIASRHGSISEVIAHNESAIAVARDAGESEAWSRGVLVNAYRQIGDLQLNGGHPVLALQAYRNAIRVSEMSADASEASRYQLATLYEGAAFALKNRGDVEGAVKETAKARNVLPALGNALPRSPSSYISVLMGITTGAGVGPLEMTRRLLAKKDLDLALDLNTRAIAADPSSNNLRATFAFLQDMNAFYQVRSDPASAVRSAQSGLRTVADLLASDPKNRVYQAYEIFALALLGRVLLDARDPTAAIIQLRQAVARAEGTSYPRPFDYIPLLESLLWLGEAEIKTREFEAATTHLQRALQISLSFWPSMREDLRSFAYIAMSYEALGDLDRARGKPEARSHYEKAAGTWRDWAANGISSSYDRAHLARVLAKLKALAPA